MHVGMVNLMIEKLNLLNDFIGIDFAKGDL